MEGGRTLSLPLSTHWEEVSAWSDDEGDAGDAQKAMDEWVGEVNRFLGGSARTSDRGGTATPKARPRPSSQRSSRIMPDSPRTPRSEKRGGFRSPSHSPPTTPHAPQTPPVFRPYDGPKTLTSPPPTARPQVPPRLPPPVLPLPSRPAASDVPEDVSSESDYGDACSEEDKEDIVPCPALNVPFIYTLAPPQRTVQFADASKAMHGPARTHPEAVGSARMGPPPARPVRVAR